MMRSILAVCTALVVLGGCGTAPPKVVAAPVPTSPTAAPTDAPVVRVEGPAVPAGVDAGVAVYDRQTGTFLAQVNGNGRFRSASLVKVFIAIDYLWNEGPDYTIPEADRTRFELMLRGSDDSAASYFYNMMGRELALLRVFSRLQLQDTKPPSAVGLNGWGSTTLTANDMVRTYLFLLEKAPAGLRDAIMGHLHQSTPCGTDHYYQNFGIPLAFAGQPWAAKQGWWGFGDNPTDVCDPPNTLLPVPAKPAITGDKPAMMSGRVLHSTGTVGANDRYVVAVLTHFPSATDFKEAFAAITELTRSLPVPR